jgi:hypothetical protein
MKHTTVSICLLRLLCAVILCASERQYFHYMIVGIAVHISQLKNCTHVLMVGDGIRLDYFRIKGSLGVHIKLIMLGFGIDVIK